MTVRRSLVATAVAVLACVPSTPALAAAASAQSGGAKAPVSAGPSSDATRAAAQLRAAVAADRARHHTSAKKRQTGEFKSESTPLSGGSTTTKTASRSGDGGGTSIVRTIGGLLLVVGAIYGLAWVLRKVKRSREEQASGRGLQSIATLPLGAGRSLHLVRAGTDVIVVGTSEHGVAPIARYTEEEALANGVLDGGQGEAMRDSVASFMPDGSPQPPLGNGWRALDAGGAPRMIDLLRRLTVRS